MPHPLLLFLLLISGFFLDCDPQQARGRPVLATVFYCSLRHSKLTSTLKVLVQVPLMVQVESPSVVGSPWNGPQRSPPHPAVDSLIPQCELDHVAGSQHPEDGTSGGKSFRS